MKLCFNHICLLFHVIPPYIRMLSSDWLMKGVFFFTNSQTGLVKFLGCVVSV
jgi:hypothetical protein